MRKFSIALLILITTMALFAPVSSAQVPVSDDCTNIAALGGALPLNTSGDFFENETIEVTVSGPGTFMVTINGVVTPDLADTGTAGYIVSVAGSISIQAEVTGGTIDSSVSLSCIPDDGTSDVFDGTICHIPPGNPDAAHTITVGSQNAVDAHMRNHGDTLGACGEGVETRLDLPALNITVFIIFASDTIQIFGECDDVCEEVINTPILLIVDFEQVVVEGENGLEFIILEESEEIGFMIDEGGTDGLSVVIYYLHPDPEDSTVGVFQINIYEDGELLDDSILVFINTEGEIVRWTSHNVWDEGEEDEG